MASKVAVPIVGSPLSSLSVPSRNIWPGKPAVPREDVPRTSLSTIGSDTSSRPVSITSGALSTSSEIVFGLANADAQQEQPALVDGPEPSEVQLRSEHSFIPLPSRYVFMFINPRSGPQQGRLLLERVEVQHFRLKSFPQVQVQIYDVTDEADRTAGEEYLRWIWCESPVFKESHQELHVWSAGGDGTFKSVLDICLRLGIDLESPLLFFSVIPFGTGNDLSQVVGWGRTVPERDVAGRRLERLNSLVTDRLNGTAARLDIWEVEIEVEPDGFVRKAGAKKPHADDGGCQSFLKTKMSNYFSLGLQGMIGSYFEARRTSSRIGNILVYARASFHYLVRGFPHVIDSLRSIDVGGVPVIHIGKEEQEQARRQSSGRNLGTPAAPSGPPLLRQNGVELIVANIPGLWGRQVDLWSTARNKQSVVENASGPTDYRNWNPNSAQDGKLEMFIIRNVGEYMLKQLPWHRGKLSRVGQFPSPSKIVFRENVSTFCNIDGEFFELHKPKSIKFTKVYTVKVVCPSDPGKSRLLRDEGIIPGAPNAYVLPVDIVV